MYYINIYIHIHGSVLCLYNTDKIYKNMYIIYTYSHTHINLCMCMCVSLKATQGSTQYHT